MNIESQRRMKIAQRNERARQMARDEIAWLNRKYRLQVYTFEHGGTQLSATFLEADDGGDEPNAYLIKLTAKTELGVTGQAYIIDSKISAYEPLPRHEDISASPMSFCGL
jgi:hypothetical protein